jgi:hypothetical protein
MFGQVTDGGGPLFSAATLTGSAGKAADRQRGSIGLSGVSGVRMLVFGVTGRGGGASRRRGPVAGRRL